MTTTAPAPTTTAPPLPAPIIIAVAGDRVLIGGAHPGTGTWRTATGVVARATATRIAVAVDGNTAIGSPPAVPWLPGMAVFTLRRATGHWVRTGQPDRAGAERLYRGVRAVGTGPA